jgi:hypothetical protein
MKNTGTALQPPPGMSHKAIQKNLNGEVVKLMEQLSDEIMVG